MDVVGRPATPAAFPGLYPSNFVDNPFVSKSVLLLTSQWRSQTAVLAIDINSGEVVAITDVDPTQGSWAMQVRTLGLTSQCVVQFVCLACLHVRLCSMAQMVTGRGHVCMNVVNHGH